MKAQPSCTRSWFLVAIWHFFILFSAAPLFAKQCNKIVLSGFCSIPTIRLRLGSTNHINDKNIGRISQECPAKVLYSAIEEREAKSTDDATNKERIVTILDRGPNHIIAMKPPSVVCHHSNWAGSKKKKLKDGEQPEIPMLQRVRDAIDSIDRQHNAGGDLNEDNDGVINDKERSMRKINLVHRLDRGASGALLFAFADDYKDSNDADVGLIDVENNQNDGSTWTGNQEDQPHFEIKKKIRKKGPTACLQAEMAKETTIKTYVAIVRGEGILRGEDFKQKGWFEVNRPIKDETGRLNDAITLFRFVAGQAEPQGDNVSDDDKILQPRLCIVLARPQNGRWHQIRRHLNGLSHPILGDTSHGSSKTNREWKEKRNLPGERICLHLAKLQMPPTEFTPAIDCACPLPADMLNVLQVYAPNVLKDSMDVLEQEGILVHTEQKFITGTYKIPEKLDDVPSKDEVKILCSGENYVVVCKPPGVVVHQSAWTRGKRNEALPMVQQVRDATNKKVNPIHRLDRSASGCLIFSFVDDDDEKSKEITNTLINSLKSAGSQKTYVALCDGDGKWSEQNFLEKGWFTIDQPVKDENGKLINAVTDLFFVAGVTLPSSDEDITEGRKVSLVLARPKTGRYHQIRQHLASGTVGHAILGDSTHGRSRTNRIWKKERGLMKERTCLHLMKIELPETKFSPNGIKCTCPLPRDLFHVLKTIPVLLERAKPILLQEGLIIEKKQ